MNIVPSQPRPSIDIDDDAQWQRANNEGWPDADAARWTWSPGARSPAVALAAPVNVVDMHAWRRSRDPMRGSSRG